MHWVILGAAILFEVSGTVGMKFSEGFKNVIPSVLVFVFYGFSFAGLIFALEKITISTAYVRSGPGWARPLSP